jgi:hypothetical protein
MSSAPEALAPVKMIVPPERGRRQNQEELFHDVRGRAAFRRLFRHFSIDRMREAL